ncbi:MAG: ribonuclease III [Pirellulaceae bacterium]|nr:ribonuclease III [Pirellulaceae bacterium]
MGSKKKKKKAEGDEVHLERVADCERCLSYVFTDKAILESALAHSSGVPFRLASNERLEFLGDAVLEIIVCDFLYQNYPKSLEGGLTKIKSVAVSREVCAEISREIGLGEFLRVGKGMPEADNMPMSLLANVFEAVTAAIYLDGGMESAREFVLRYIGPKISEITSSERIRNFKSALQQIAQREFGEPPKYYLLQEEGPDHSKVFQIVAVIGKRRFSAAWGKNKKEAEQRAAANAIAEMNEEEPPYPIEKTASSKPPRIEEL